MQTTINDVSCSGRFGRLGALVTALWLASACTNELQVPTDPDDTDGPVTAPTGPATTADVDLPADCAGVLAYLNGASKLELYSLLPNALADAILARRTVRPFDSLADLSSVPGIAQGRLSAIWRRAVDRGFVEERRCVGIYEELGVSAADRDAILIYVNTATEAELVTVARAQEKDTARAIVRARPYTSLQALADTPNVGPETFRSIRNAAIDGPFDLLVDRVNTVHRDAIITTNFDWFELSQQVPGRRQHTECFGVSQGFTDQVSADLRPYLADAGEVVASLTDTVRYANRDNEVGDPTAGLADLAALAANQTFFGCYLSFAPDPWSGVNRAFYVNTITGFRIFTETRWSE